MRSDGMFAILVPETLLPLILTLFWAEDRAKRTGIVERVFAAEGIPRVASSTSYPNFYETRAHYATDSKAGLKERIRHIAEQLDLVGLILLGSAVGLILLPLSLAKKSEDGWANRFY